MASLEKPVGSSAHTHEMKAEVDATLHGDTAGEPVGLRAEDQDLGQFGYKPELKVRKTLSTYSKPTLIAI